jgi:putative two-component system response regulator
MKDISTILIVDDIHDNIIHIGELLKDIYRVKFATNGKKALKIADTGKPDLILLDIMMPEMDGYEVCEVLKSNRNTHEIPVIFLTSKNRVEDEKKGFDLGAVDYITKPVSPPLLLARIKTHLRLKEANDFLKNQNEILDEKVRLRTKQLSVLQDATMVAMGSLAETRDNETGNHIRRTQHYIKSLALSLRKNPIFEDELTDDYIELLYKSAPLHDIGKVGVPDRILLKPGKLSFEEYEEMKMHTVYGRDAIISAEKCIEDEDSDDFLKLARTIAYSHQERWDGSGYPNELSGDEIPLAARLMAVADVYDALISKRVYKEPVSHEESVEIIKNSSGKHFDPDIVDAFLRVEDEIYEISTEFSGAEGLI